METVAAGMVDTSASAWLLKHSPNTGAAAISALTCTAVVNSTDVGVAEEKDAVDSIQDSTSANSRPFDTVITANRLSKIPIFEEPAYNVDIPIHSKDVPNIFLSNVRSVMPKMDELSAVLSNTFIDITALTES